MKNIKLKIKILLNLIFTAQFSLIFILSWILSTLPKIEDAINMRCSCFIKILDKNGNLIAQYGDFFEKPLSAEELPPNLIWAIVDTEDKNFYKHKGIDFIAITRSIFLNLFARKIISGASTITQQLAKNILQNEEKISYNDRSFFRKIKEALFTLKLERKFKKNEILALYLNRVYFGYASFGINAAAKAHFKKHPKELTLFECAALMGILKAPTKYSHNNEAWKKRTKYVLQHMLINKHITQKEYEEALLGEIPIKEKRSNIYYFTDYIIQNIPKNISNQDLIITTTIDLKIQEKANESIQYAYNIAGKEWNANAGAMIIINKNGAILAIIGGLDYSQSQFNRATSAKRSTGSFFKYFTYMEAIKQGLNIDSKIYDNSIEIGAWAPSNYLYKSCGEISIKDAFARSVNSVAVYLLMACGITNVIKTAKQLGIKEHIARVPAIALGGFNTTLLDLSSTLIPIINEGYKIKPYCIYKIQNAHTKEILYKHEYEAKQVLDQKTIYYVWNLLKHTVKIGSCRALNIPNKIVGAKSGTSNEYKDLLIIGATSEYIFGCWFGRDDFQPMQYTPGKNLPLIACRKFLLLMPECNNEIKIEINFKPNKKTFEDLLGK